MVDQPICRRNRRSHYVCVVAVRQYASFAKLRWEEGLGPGRELPVGGPGTVPVPGESMDETDVDSGVQAIMQNLHPIRESRDQNGGLGWSQVCVVE